MEGEIVMDDWGGAKTFRTQNVLHSKCIIKVSDD